MRRWYHGLMKLSLALLIAAFSFAAGVNPQMKLVNSVYILSMGGGMDQFLANQLTSSGLLQVVTDPQKADAIITDRLGEGFEAKLKDLYPPPATEEKKAEKEKPAAQDSGSADNLADGGPPQHMTSSFNRGKGNLFVVDRKTRNVIWSTYERPKDFTPGELDRVAAKIVKRLKNDLNGK